MRACSVHSFVERRAYVTGLCGAFSTHPMPSLAKRMHAGSVDPSVIEIEKRANRDGIVDRRVRPAGVVQRRDIGGADVNRVAIHLIDEAQQRLLGFGQRRRFEIFDDGQDQGFVPEQFRRNCGVGLQSKRAIVARGSVGSDEFPQAGADRAGFAHDGLREALEVLRGLRLKREHMPDLRVLAAGVARGLDEIAERAFGFRGFHFTKKHGFHSADFLS